MYLAKVYVSLRSTVSDPQGLTIQGGLHQLGFEDIVSVRAGKYMEIKIDQDTESEAARQVESMCDKLLTNPIIEEYRFELEPVD
jgi:phosphoribosylformylglycinamidine synthase